MSGMIPEIIRAALQTCGGDLRPPHRFDVGCVVKKMPPNKNAGV
jgi:hypothetical protein